MGSSGDKISLFRLKFGRKKGQFVKSKWYRLLNRKQIITMFLVISPFLATLFVDSNQYIALSAVFIGATISSDYKFPVKYISDRAYDWIQNNDSLTEAINQNKTAAEYNSGDYGVFDLTNWENGNFWAKVSNECPITEGMIFRIRCNVEDASGEFTYPITLCVARVDSVKAPAESVEKREITMDLTNWVLPRGSGKRDKNVHTKKQLELLNGDESLNPHAKLDITREFKDLTPEEWNTLGELLSKTSEY